MKKAETVWIKHTQRQCFEEEYNSLILSKEGTVVYKHQLLFINDDKLICCKGRLEYADVPICAKNPVLLPNKHRFTGERRFSGIGGIAVMAETLEFSFWTASIHFYHS